MKKILLMFAVIALSVTAGFSQKVAGQPNQPKQPKMLDPSQRVPADMHTPSQGVLVLVAHPNLKESTANKALYDVATGVDKVEVIDLYSLKKFNVDEFKEKVDKVNAIVFQFPFYYASAPAKMKEWIDDVFYMFSKESIQGKALMVAVTTGSEESAYRSGGRNMFTVDELLRPYQLTANHSGMVWQTPFVVYGMSTKDAEKNLTAACKSYKTTLETLSRFAPNGIKKRGPGESPRKLDKPQNREMDPSVHPKSKQGQQRATQPRN